MKITLIRKDEEQGTEALSLCDTDAFFEKVKTENKAGHISELREILPRLAGSSARYVHIDKLPRVYPAVEYTRKQKGEKRMKHYNGLVQLEVNRLADLYEVEYVKRQVEQLPQTFAAFCGSSGRSVKIWIRFARTDGSLPNCHTRSPPVSCPRLSAGGDMLPAHASFRHHTEGTGPDAKLSHDRG